MSTTLHKDNTFGSPNCTNVVLYHSDNPVISVEQGTTFGLVKMLYESIGGHGQIIGLAQRQSGSSLPCIITQDQTILTEREYDIILHGKSKEKSVVKSPSICHDKDVNTYISVKPDAQIWPAYSFPAPGQIPWGKDLGNFGKRMETYGAKDGLSWSERRDSQGNIDGLAANDITKQRRINPVGVSNALEYEVSRKKRIIDDENEEIRVVSPSISPSTTSAESPTASSQDSPSQVEQSPKRKWQCFYCKKFFVCRSAYDNHERTHTGEKPFRCDVCGRSFGHQGNLKQHMHIHRDVKPHICDVCGRGFTRSNRLRDHKRSHQYELYMHTKVQWSTSKNVAREERSEPSPVSSNAFEESAASDENQETS